MSIGIYGSVSTIVLYTMVTKNLLKVIYFNGQLALLTTIESLNSQIAVLGLYIPINPKYNYIYNKTLKAH